MQNEWQVLIKNGSFLPHIFRFTVKRCMHGRMECALFYPSKTLPLLHLTQELIKARSVRVQIEYSSAEVTENFVPDSC